MGGGGGGGGAKKKKKRSPGEGRIGELGRGEGGEGWSEKKSPDLRSPEVGISAEGRQPAANLTIVKDEKLSKRKKNWCLTPSTMLNNDSKRTAVVSLKPLSAGFS